jgi:hypothetical protein
VPDPTIADLIGCQIEGYVVTGYREPYGQVVVCEVIFGTADEARDEADQWQHVAALVRLEDGPGD